MNKNTCKHNFMFLILLEADSKIWEAFLAFILGLKGFYTRLRFQNFINTAGLITKRTPLPSGGRHQNFEHNLKTEINLNSRLDTSQLNSHFKSDKHNNCQVIQHTTSIQRSA